MNNEFPSKENKNLFEGYVFSFNRNKFNLVQMRILFRIVEFAQSEIEGLVIAQNMCQIKHNLRNVTISLPTSSVMSEGSKHYEQVHKACKQMQEKVVEWYDDVAKVWHSSAIISNVEIAKNTGYMVFDVPSWVWDSILNFSRGFRKLELSVLMSLKTANAMKMYQLIAGQKQPITYNITWLKQYFGVADKYTQVTDFIRKVLQPSKEELDKSCPYTFEYRPVKVSRSYKQVTFFPVEQKEKRDENLVRKELMAKIPASLLVGDAYRYMRYNMGFDAGELAANKKLLDDAAHHLPNLLDILSSIEGRRRKADGTIMGKGWIINALRGEVAKAIKERKEKETFR